MKWQSTPRRWIGVLGLTAAALAAAACAFVIVALDGPGTARAGAGTTSAARVDTRGFPQGPGDAGIFTEGCRLSHVAADDPILMPGQPGRAMRHDFFGNVATNAGSTAARLRGGATTCRTSADASAYWTPVLYQRGRPLTPIRALIYWRRARRSRTTVHTIPAGLQMIAGDETATAPQGVKTVAWSCTTPGTDARPDLHATPVGCPAGEHLKLTIRFPSCWDGHTLSADHTDNVVDPVSPRAGCPSSHPVALAQIVFHVVYPTTSAADLTLSMSPTMTGSTDTAHADFIDGWRAPVLARDVAACVNASVRCGPVRGAQATPQGPRRR